MSDAYEGSGGLPDGVEWRPFEEPPAGPAPTAWGAEAPTNGATDTGAASRWRPGSPVTPVGSRYGASRVAAPPPPPPPPPPYRPYRPGAGLLAFAVLLAAAAGVGIGHVAWPGSSPSISANGISPGGTGGVGGSGGSSSQGGSGFGGQPFGGSGAASGGAPTQGSGAPANVATIAKKVDPALVDVNSTFSYQEAAGAGTGIVLTSNGEILTNNHVINGATKISVTDIGNGRTYPATVVGYDSTHDIAVLQLTGASGLTTASISSSAASVGEPVVAIGNAGGVGGTPTSAGGSITALRRSITAGDELDGTSEQLSGLIQVNADVQSGDSGGSLVNAKGQVVGMDTAASAGFSFQTSGTQGYAIPISQALSTARGIESGTAGPDVHVGATAFLGLKINAATGGSASSGGFPGSAAGNSGSSGTPAAAGATVNSVVAGGAAQSAGIGANDVITSLDGKAISSPSALSKALVPYHPGNKVTIGWTDPSGSPHTATVALGSGPPA